MNVLWNAAWSVELTDPLDPLDWPMNAQPARISVAQVETANINRVFIYLSWTLSNQRGVH
jgi:hypothetical protein